MTDGTPSGEPVGEAEDYGKFLRSRQMFCVKGGKLFLAPPGLAISHLDWFRQEGWVDGGNGDEEKFFRHVVRGYYVPGDNAIYCFKETDFVVDAEMMEADENTAATEREIAEAVIRQLPHLKEALHLKNDARIFLGPKKIGPTAQYPKQKYIGTIETVLRNNPYKGRTEIQYGNKE